ncbi:REP-associated tyrosine transposase [Oceanobacter kriegii]|uniref:REP-associated tyrosine transposase n=1 Tax=Oceanobacter kriegii TaxID=64972 RepID=UPI0004805F9B|nr:transposase [Oceanobacter kriegii]
MDYRRSHIAGACYFFTVVTHHRRPILVENIGLLRAAFRQVKVRYPFDIHGIVVLPDHLHCLWQLPPYDSNNAIRWSQIKSLFSRELPSFSDRPSLKNKREKGIWQRRFWEHVITDEHDWRTHMDYIHFNPVKHGYSKRPCDWRWSSFEQCVAKGWYSPDWGQPHDVLEVERLFIE